LNRDFKAMLDDLRSALERPRPEPTRLERPGTGPAQGKHRDGAAKA
jgi:hypothetical protein